MNKWLITTCQIQVTSQSLSYLTTNTDNFRPLPPSTEDCSSVFFIADLLSTYVFQNSVHNPLLFCIDTVPEPAHFLSQIVSTHRTMMSTFLFHSQISLLKSRSTPHVLAIFIQMPCRHSHPTWPLMDSVVPGYLPHPGSTSVLLSITLLIFMTIFSRY